MFSLVLIGCIAANLGLQQQQFYPVRHQPVRNRLEPHFAVPDRLDQLRQRILSLGAEFNQQVASKGTIGDTEYPAPPATLLRTSATQITGVGDSPKINIAPSDAGGELGSPSRNPIILALTAPDPDFLFVLDAEGPRPRAAVLPLLAWRVDAGDRAVTRRCVELAWRADTVKLACASHLCDVVRAWDRRGEWIAPRPRICAPPSTRARPLRCSHFWRGAWVPVHSILPSADSKLKRGESMS
ncbi:hypothetical protein C8J57DRAFT_1533200 [Mycena rebaudengoi]|nr:hypothetical protein C8J57DRAFT_1533200 [Mycena rebaudengoi]